MFEGLAAKFVIGDKGYDSNEIIEQINAAGAQAIIPPRSNRKNPRDCDFALYAQRYRIECFFNKLKHYRGIATRYCKRARNFQSLIYLAAALIWIR